MFNACKRSLAYGVRLKHDHFILARSQKVRRDKQRLLRADLPVAAKMMSVYPNMAFAPRSRVEISVAQSLQIECASIKGWRVRFCSGLLEF